MRILLLSMMLTVALYNTAGAALPLNDTGNLGKPHRLTQQQFLDKYGKDDTSRALIRYYFQRRKDFGNAGLITTALAAVSGVLFQVLVIDAKSSKGLGGLMLGIVLLSGLWGFGLIALVLITKWLTLSRRRLYKLIRNYNGGEGIPKRVMHKSLFNKILEDEKDRK